MIQEVVWLRASSNALQPRGWCVELWRKVGHYPETRVCQLPFSSLSDPAEALEAAATWVYQAAPQTSRSGVAGRHWKWVWVGSHWGLRIPPGATPVIRVPRAQLGPVVLPHLVGARVLFGYSGPAW